MLDEFCNGLSDKAQLKIALRLLKTAMPVWNNYFEKNPGKIEELNLLIIPTNKVQGAAQRIEKNFPESSLAEIESALQLHENENSPLKALYGKERLKHLMFTFIQPLTNIFWETTFPRSVRLVYTGLWNTLTWMLYRQKNVSGETHIYVAINQAADALLSENILTAAEINEILKQYKSEIRTPEDDSYWMAMNESPQGQAGSDPDEMYRKLINKVEPEVVVEEDSLSKILRQMREDGKKYWDKMEEYQSGNNKTYYYDKEKKAYFCAEMDTIAATYFYENEMTEKEMRNIISKISPADLREQGFNI